MNIGSFSGFFYNLVPGSLFVLGIVYYKIIDTPSIDLKGYEGLSLYLIIIFGLFFGFLFQSFIKILRGILLDWITISATLFFNRQDWSVVKGKFKNGSKLSKFYKMDILLRGDNPLISHFSSRLAFWSNVLMAILAFLLLEFYFKKNTPIDFWLHLLFYISLINYLYHQYSYHDTILKTYIVNHRRIDKGKLYLG